MHVEQAVHPWNTVGVDLNDPEVVFAAAPSKAAVDVGIVITALVLIVSVYRMTAATGADALHATNVALALFLVTTIAAGFRLGLYSTKLTLYTTPLYLLAILLPASLAAAAAGGGVLAGALLAGERNNVAGIAGRWMLVTLLGSLTWHLWSGASWDALPFLTTALSMLAADLMTAPLVVTPESGEHLLGVMAGSIRTICIIEGSQYLLGLLGAMAMERQAWTLALLVLPTLLIHQAFKHGQEAQDTTLQILENMADTVDLRDPYTGGHSRRVTDYCRVILREMGIGGSEASLLITAARVHDIGKIAVPDAILKKPGPLTPEERAVMETHSERGADVVRRYKDFARGVDIVLYHHEAWDGSGYPHRLRGMDIPFGARVLAVADSYDAMTSDRPYRRGMSPEKAASILRQGRGQQWDATIVDAFLQAMAHEIEPATLPALSTSSLSAAS